LLFFVGFNSLPFGGFLSISQSLLPEHDALIDAGR
jgi:hypothetical protein